MNVYCEPLSFFYFTYILCLFFVIDNVTNINTNFLPAYTYSDLTCYQSKVRTGIDLKIMIGRYF